MKKIVSTIISLVILSTFCLFGVAESQTTTIKVSNYFPVTAEQSKMCEEFIKSIEASGKGKVKFSYFGGGTLNTAPKMMDGVIQGITDIGLSNLAYTPGRFPISDVLNLPLGFPNAWVATQVANDFVEKFKPKDWDKVHLIALHSCGPKFILTRKKAITRLEDFKGVTLRGYGYEADLIRALGGTPRGISMPDTYDALLKGVVEGATMTLESLKQWRMAEVTKHVTECSEIGKVEVFYLIMNKNKWNSLPADVKQLFNEYPFRNKFAEVWYRIDQEGKDYGEKKGVKFYSIPKDELPKWQSAAQQVVENYVKNTVSAGYKEKDVREWISFIKQRITYWEKKQKESGKN